MTGRTDAALLVQSGVLASLTELIFPMAFAEHRSIDSLYEIGETIAAACASTLLSLAIHCATDAPDMETVVALASGLGTAPWPRLERLELLGSPDMTAALGPSCMHKLMHLDIDGAELGDTFALRAAPCDQPQFEYVWRRIRCQRYRGCSVW